MNEDNSSNDSNIVNQKKKMIKYFTSALLTIVLGLIVNFLTPKLSAFYQNIKTLLTLPEKITQFEISLNDIEQRLNKLETAKSTNRNIEENNNSNEKSVNPTVNIENIETFNFGKNMRLTEEWETSMIESSVEIPYFLAEPKWNKDDLIALNIKNGTKYTAKQLENQKILLPYKTKDTSGNIIENYFWGKFNENNHWDGNCVINVYCKNVLIAILDATYNDGDLISYKQAMQTSGVWKFSNRTKEDNKNNGETKDYSYIKVAQKFKFDDVTYKDIKKYNEFEKEIMKTSNLKSFYYGDTSDELYNDNTGKSYYVKYSDKGKVETLYIGNFKNGKFDDDTGNAQEIVYDASNNMNKYFYYKGIFKEGIRQGKVDASNYVTQKQIDKILEGIEFSCELKWHKTN